MKSFTKLGGGDLKSCVKYSGACTEESSWRIMDAFFFVLHGTGSVRPNAEKGERRDDRGGRASEPFHFVQNIVEDNDKEVSSYNIGATPDVMVDDPRNTTRAGAQKQLNI